MTMKKLLISYLLLCVAALCSAQEYTVPRNIIAQSEATNPISLTTTFQQANTGYYYQTNMYTSGVKNTTGDFNFYSFNKKGKTAHFFTSNAHGYISLDKANLKFFTGIAKQNNIPCLEGIELSMKQSDIEEQIKQHYEVLNDSVKQVRILERQKFVADSIRKAEIDSIKAVQDSIERARRDSLKLIAEKQHLDSLMNALDSINNLMKIEYNKHKDFGKKYCVKIVGVDWSSNSVGGISIKYGLINYSPHKIKYVTFNATFYNPVGDKCYASGEGSNCQRRGIGPVEAFPKTFEEYRDNILSEDYEWIASWEFDNRLFYARNAERVKLTSVTIEFWDGHRTTLSGNNLKVEYKYAGGY